MGLDKGKYSGLERQLNDYHARACLYAGLHLFGTSREESVGQVSENYNKSPVLGPPVVLSESGFKLLLDSH